MGAECFLAAPLPSHRLVRTVSGLWKCGEEHCPVALGRNFTTPPPFKLLHVLSSWVAHTQHLKHLGLGIWAGKASLSLVPGPASLEVSSHAVQLILETLWPTRLLLSPVSVISWAGDWHAFWRTVFKNIIGYKNIGTLAVGMDGTVWVITSSPLLFQATTSNYPFHKCSSTLKLLSFPKKPPVWKVLHMLFSKQYHSNNEIGEIWRDDES